MKIISYNVHLTGNSSLPFLPFLPFLPIMDFFLNLKMYMVSGAYFSFNSFSQ